MPTAAAKQLAVASARGWCSTATAAAKQLGTGFELQMNAAENEMYAHVTKMPEQASVHLHAWPKRPCLLQAMPVEGKGRLQA